MSAQRIIAVLALCLLAACSRHDGVIHGDRVLCAMDGSAFKARDGVGDTSFVERMPEADALCRPLKTGSASS